MLFDNMLFHNVAELEKNDVDFIMWRVPKNVREGLSLYAAAEVSRYCAGVEIRFKIKGESATLILQAEKSLEAQVAYIYYGSIQGGWQNSSHAIDNKPTRIEIKKPDNMEVISKITEEKNLPFSSEVVRVILPYGKIYYLGVEGEVEVPGKEEMPNKTYLAYGSSITHGSMALAAPYTYPFRVAEKLKCDYVNLGYAGSAYMEKIMADFIVSRKDWDFATVEMGVNMLREPVEKFEHNIHEFIEILSKEERPILATSILGLNDPIDVKIADQYRNLVEKYTKGRLAFVDGLELLNDPAYISQDMVHPTVNGMELLANRWVEHLTELVNNR